MINKFNRINAIKYCGIMVKHVFKKEFWKMIVLIILIILSIIQIGILWSYQSYGIPFRFFQEMFGYKTVNNFVDTREHSEEFLLPKRIVISGKFEQFYWIFDDKTEKYDEMWSEAKNYLIDLLNFSKLQSKIEVIPREVWWDQLKEQVIIYEFEARYDQNTIRMLLNLTKSNTEIPKGIYKIAISPYDKSVAKNQNEICMYILDENNLYRLSLPIKNKRKPKSWYDDLVNYCNDSKDLKKYELAGKYFSADEASPLDISNDIFISLRDDTSRKFKNVRIIKPDKLSKVNEVSKAILGKGIENYVTYVGSDGAIIFQNLDSYYKISKSGFLQYVWKQKCVRDDKGAESLALEKALEFLDRSKNVIKDSDGKIMLTNISQDNDSYKFTFDYKVGNLAVVAESNNNLESAIKIKANSKKVLECNWLIRTFKLEYGYKYYNEFFMTLVNNKKFEPYNRKIVNVNIAYGDINEKNGILKPRWLVRTDDGKYKSYDMVEK